MSIRLNLGCGDSRLEGMIGVDILIRKGTEVVCDLESPLPFASQAVDFVYAKSILEHIEHFELLVSELHRVLSSSGELYIYVPHWRNPSYYSDYSHKRFFGLYTFDYFSSPIDQLFRSVPTYSIVRFQTLEVKLLFNSPFRFLHWLMKAFQWVINLGKGCQLFYEFHVSGFIPCYALEYRLRKKLPNL